ncbi:MAG TPA: energy transducer TonB [Pyrinomonadaceae bacterium]|jgi:TonB family protein
MRFVLARYPVLLALLFNCASFCLAQGVEPPRQKISPIDEFNPETWPEFQSAPGRFSALLPGTPGEKVRREEFPAGTIETHSYVLRNSNQSPQYNVMYFDFPAGAEIVVEPREVFNGARDEALKAVKGKLLEEREDNSIGYPGRFYKVRTADGLMRIKAFIVKTRFYNLSYTTEGKTESASTRLHDEWAAKFLDSFRLLSEQELAKFEGEVDRLLKSLRERNEVVIGVCAEGTGCEAVPSGSVPANVNQGRVESGRILSQPQPVYPPIAKAARAQGVVKVQVIVDESGKVIAAQVLGGHPLLQAAAVKAAREVAFAPTLLDGKPVKIAGVITYDFVLPELRK